MDQYIPKSVLLAEIESLEDKGKYHEEYDCAYRDGNNSALYALKNKLDTLEVKEVDLKQLYREYINNTYTEEFAQSILDDNIKGDLDNPDLFGIMSYGFELGLKASNPITAADRGTAEEIIINLKRVEKDYRIDLTKAIEWLRSKVKKGE